MSVLRETVQSSIQAALLQQRSHPQHFWLPSLATAVPSYRAPGVATTLGLNRPLDKSIHQGQVPEIQLRVADSTPGSLGSPITMVRKRKPAIDTFNKWIDAFTAYIGLLCQYSTAVPQLIKYEQIISLAVSKFKCLAWLSYDEQFHRHAAHDLTLSWDKIDLELWAVTFSVLAKPYSPAAPVHTTFRGIAQLLILLVAAALIPTAMTLSGLPDAYAIQTAHSLTSAAGASLPVTPYATALTTRQVVPGMQATANAARSKGPLLSTPIDVDCLQLELADHPDLGYSDFLTHMLGFGTCIGYTGLHRPSISRNLISPSEHSDSV